MLPRQRHSHVSPLPGEIGTTTPLGGPVAPQKPQSGNGNGLGIRPDGFAQASPPARKRPHGKAPVKEKQCARPACKKWFTPKRSNQDYCPDSDCRQRAHDERMRKLYTGNAAAKLVSVLRDLRNAPDQLCDSREQAWARLLHLAERAESALKFWKAEVESHGSKK